MEETQYYQSPSQPTPPQQPQQGPTPPQQPQKGPAKGIDWGGEIQNFFKNDLKSLFVNLFKFPGSGTQRFLDTSSKTMVNPICMVALSFLVFMLLPYFIVLMKAPAGIPTPPIKPFFCLGLTPVFFSLFITLSMFILMAIKQKNDFLLAFRHSTVHVFIFTVVMVLAVILSLFTEKSALDFLLGGGSGIGLKFSSVILMLLIVYAISLGISAVRQTLGVCDNSGKEGYVWYLSPLVVILSLWLTMLIVSKMIFQLL